MGEQEPHPEFEVRCLGLIDEDVVYLRQRRRKLPRRTVKDESDFRLWKGCANLAKRWGCEDRVADPLKLEDKDVH